MHDTARCLGYPSDSTRAARERARETTSGSHLDRDGRAVMEWMPPSPLAPVARPSPLWLNSRPSGSTPLLLAHGWPPAPTGAAAVSSPSADLPQPLECCNGHYTLQSSRRPI